MTSPGTITRSGRSSIRIGSSRVITPGCLVGVGPRPDAEAVVGRRQAEVAEEGVAHEGVVVLAGVHEDLVEADAAGRSCGGRHVAVADGGDDRRRLHEVGPRSDDVEELEAPADRRVGCGGARLSDHHPAARRSEDALTTSARKRRLPTR